MTSPELPLLAPAITYTAPANILGYVAQSKRLPLSANPYPAESPESKEWSEGWAESLVDDTES